ncbi:alcohol oxidase [Lindgomyces ingoldianus]|uniref:Alcohol oxidase n=1 Tax=Lindgomyces ingoldianus TaxID=673940 RepID=A0ACB6RB60_9PLEO|nr:alcohol oxidase [Lindgomyces ingoldianus]KAF2476504.1 alcohol oxidase [Lindgomyces ingoldianus]
MSAEDFVQKSYDYVICGGGTAGLVLAARLSEDPNITVGVLEAGENRLNDPLIDAPALYIQTWEKPEYDWCFKTVPQKGTANRVHGWARGKVLGGSSAINYNMFSMASRQDLDNWAELGNKGWGFNDMAPYYRKFETYNPPSKILSSKINDRYVDPLLRGTSGPIQISFCEADFQWAQEAWPETCINAGYPAPKDPRSGSAIGGFNQLTTVNPKTMQRSYSARDYYEPNAGRRNLSVLTEALVAKIEFEKGGSGNAIATGVKFFASGAEHTVKANKEVIVCGGVICSPQILELSGIGSASRLQNVGIEIVVDNPNVGENLNEHSATGISLAVKDEYPTAEVLLRNPEIAQQAMEAYITHKAGPFANAPTTTGFVSLSLADPNLADPEKHINTLISDFQKANPDADPAGRAPLLGRQILDPKEAIAQVVLLSVGADIRNSDSAAKLFMHDAPGNWITLGVCSTRSLSRGSVHIESPDPKKHPVIDPAYYSHPLDLDLAARGILHAISLTQYEPLHSKMKRDEKGGLILPPWIPAIPTTLEEAKEVASSNTVTEYHPIGTCAMLPKEKGGVVDSDCKVYGTSNVRVVDASIFPTNVQGNIISLIYAVAEKAADIIKGKTSDEVNGH